MTNDKPMPKWRNFAVWSAVGALVYAAIVLAAFSLRPEGVAGALFESGADAAKVALALTLRGFVNFVILSLVAIAVFLSAMWGLGVLGGSAAPETMSFSKGTAAAIGTAYLAIGLLTLSLRAGVRFMDAERADDIRQQALEFAYAAGGSMAWGLALIVLAFAGAGGAIPPSPALAGAVVLLAVSSLLGFAQWRHMDELKRRLSQECGNWSFYLILAVGGSWAILAHLGFAAAPSPLDWLSMFSVLMLVASVIATGRRGLLESR